MTDAGALIDTRYLWSRAANRAYAIGLARAFAGAIVFSLPLLMTMEMWAFGFSLSRPNMLVDALVNFVLLFFLSRVAGFEETASRTEDLLDAFAAFGVGAVGAATILFAVGAIGPGMGAGEIAGKIAVQAMPASFGAMLADKLLGEPGETPRQHKWRASYAGQLFLMLAGALLLCFTVATTEEMVLIAVQITPWHALALVLGSLILLHVLVYTVGFAGQEKPHSGGAARTFVHFTLPGYAIAVAAALYILWTFERTDGADAAHIAMMAAVVAFPGALGAAIARLVV
ncbi:MAG: TIGR02587 family membrane protein [Sphingosinicella sp.]